MQRTGSKLPCDGPGLLFLNHASWGRSTPVLPVRWRDGHRKRSYPSCKSRLISHRLTQTGYTRRIICVTSDSFSKALLPWSGHGITSLRWEVAWPGVKHEPAGFIRYKRPCIAVRFPLPVAEFPSLPPARATRHSFLSFGPSAAEQLRTRPWIWCSNSSTLTPSIAHTQLCCRRSPLLANPPRHVLTTMNSSPPASICHSRRRSLRA